MSHASEYDYLFKVCLLPPRYSVISIIPVISKTRIEMIDRSGLD